MTYIQNIHQLNILLCVHIAHDPYTKIVHVLCLLKNIFLFVDFH